MAKLEGITVEINGDATGLNSALKDTNKELNSTQQELNQVNKLLKLDPGNVTLLAQKQSLLSNAIQDTSSKLQTLKTAQEQANSSGLTNTEAGQKAYRELEREIASTEQSLAKLKSQMDTTNSSLDDTSKGIKDIGTASDSAGGGAGRLGDIIKGNLASEAIIGGVKALASAVGSVVNQMVNLGKQAIESFAEYEQLVGGVETLFKDSADTVQSYANNAYKTAGLSANEYMETVTSFSASLLQSLNNDTAESAKIADMAITDMADNANKMGTSMESIQNAYQGFAKQNYTMLDNLKLGYGGTKTEMERLLQDATAISGIDYDISSLSDVYNAIHVIQGELGITGTTAEEASKTISGSVNAMKSAWTNLVTGIADDNADFGTLVDNFVDSVITAGENIIPRIEQSLDGIIELVVQLSDKLLPQVLELGSNLLIKLIEGITENIGTIAESVSTVIVSFTQTLVTLLPQIVDAGITLLLALVTGITNALPELIPAITDAIAQIIVVLTEHIDEIINAGIQILIALVKGIIDAIPVLVERLPEIIEAINTALIDNIEVIIEGGVMLTLALIEGLIKAIPELIKSIPKIIEALVNGLRGAFNKMLDVGKYLIEGLWQGILNAKDWLLNKIKSFASTITDGIKSFFGINSPSIVFRDEVGKYLAQGIGVGFTKELPSTISDMTKSLASMTEDLSADLSIDAMPSVNKAITQQNYYNTKTYQSNTEVVRQPSEVTIVLDKTKLGKVMIPVLDNERVILGGTLA